MEEKSIFDIELFIKNLRKVKLHEIAENLILLNTEDHNNKIMFEYLMNSFIGSIDFASKRFRTAYKGSLKTLREEKMINVVETHTSSLVRNAIDLEIRTYDREEKIDTKILEVIYLYKKKCRKISEELNEDEEFGFIFKTRLEKFMAHKSDSDEYRDKEYELEKLRDSLDNDNEDVDLTNYSKLQLWDTFRTFIDNVYDFITIR